MSRIAGSTRFPRALSFVRSTTVTGAALWLGLIAAPTSARAQDMSLLLELYGGIATYGRFLEQVTTEGFGALREREIRGSAGLTLGGSVGVSSNNLYGIEDVVGSLGFQWTTSDFEFENDDPRVAGDIPDLDPGSFDSYLLSLILTKFLGDSDDAVAPYATVGFNGTWWHLKDTDVTAGGRVLPAQNGDRTLFRFGGSAGFGVQFDATDEFAIRLEAMRHSIRSPFNGDGDNAWGVSTGTTMDEPDRVGMSRYSINLIYRFDL